MSEEMESMRQKDGVISPGWTALDKPIPIGAVKPPEQILEAAGKVQEEQGETAGSSALYVTSQPDNIDDVMDQIANEFQQASKGRKSKVSQSPEELEKHANACDELGNDLEDTTGTPFKAISEEQTEVWTCGEETSELTDKMSLGQNEHHPPPIMDDRVMAMNAEDSKTLYSDGSHNTDMMTNEAGPSKTMSETSNVSNSTLGKNKQRQSNKSIIPAMAGPSHEKGVSQTTKQATKASLSVQDRTAKNTHSMNVVTMHSRGSANHPSSSSQAHELNLPIADDQHDWRRPPPYDQRWEFPASGSQSDRLPPTEGHVSDRNGTHHKALLEIMSQGLGNFTNDVATIVIDKLRPEYETLARCVGQAVKEETTVELSELREKVNAAEKVLNLLEIEKNKLLDELTKEKSQMRKEIDKERLQRIKKCEEKDAAIEALEKELKKAQMLNREKDRMSRRADSKAKSEEHKRVRLEETYEARVKELQTEISKLKSEILVQKSKNRVQSSNARDIVKSGSMARKLKTYHHQQSKGKWPPVHPKGVPYDEGDP